MTSPKRLGNTVFRSNDPLDDLRPAKQKKLLSVPAAEPQEPPVKVIEVPPPAREQVTTETDSPKLSAEVPAVEAPEAAPSVESEPAKPAPRKTKETTPDAAAEPAPHGKVRFSANVSQVIKQKVENAAYWVPGLTLSAITEVALEREIRRLEKEFNGGKPFEKAGKLKYGRPRAEE
jgi:hypothetical protein